MDNHLGHNEDIALACGIKLSSTEADVLSCFAHPASMHPDDVQTVLFTSNDRFTPTDFYESRSDESFTYGLREIVEDGTIFYGFDYFCPPEWNAEKASCSMTHYYVQIWFYDHSDTISYILCCETTENYSNVG